MSEVEVSRLKCPECGGQISLWTDLHGAAQAQCKAIEACDWGTFDAAVDL